MFEAGEMLTTWIIISYIGRLYVKGSQKGDNLGPFDPENWPFNLLRKVNQVPIFFEVTAKKM